MIYKMRARLPHAHNARAFYYNNKTGARNAYVYIYAYIIPGCIMRVSYPGVLYTYHARVYYMCVMPRCIMRIYIRG